MLDQEDILARLNTLFNTAVAAALPRSRIAEAVRDLIARYPEKDPVLVAVGKAAVPMAQAAIDVLPSGTRGIVLCPYRHNDPAAMMPAEVICFEAAHPVPDAAGEAATQDILNLANGLGPEDHLIVLLSGGGSALLTMPCDGLTLVEKQAVTRDLLASGADIAKINCVRRHLSAVKGGKLAEAALPAPTGTVLISDVSGDDPAVVASGPSLRDPTTAADAIAILTRLGLPVPTVLTRPDRDREALPLNGNPIIVARARDALMAAAKQAEAWDWDATILGDDLTGDAKALARDHAALARSLVAVRPTLLLSGGETCVQLSDPSARGGRNGTYLLALALALKAASRIYALAADTDGIDGNGDNAGGWITPSALATTHTAGLEPAELLQSNSSYKFLSATGGLLTTGPTLTNVNDFRAILILPDSMPMNMEQSFKEAAAQ